MVDKLEERLLRTEKRVSYMATNRTAPPVQSEYDALINPDGPAALDEITRLNAENERLTLLLESAKEQFDRHVEWASAENERARNDALEEAARLADPKPNWGRDPESVWESALYAAGTEIAASIRALITKASRDSGHG